MKKKRVTKMADAQKFVKRFADMNGWKDFPNIDKFDHLHEELIEMSKHLRYRGEEDKVSFIKNNRDIFEDGIGDLFFGLCRLANQLDVDIEKSFDLVRGRISERYAGKEKETKS